MMTGGNGQERRFPKVEETVYYQSVDPGGADLVVYDGEKYYHQSQGPKAPPIESFDPAQYVEMSRLRRHQCEFGHYPWDLWYQWAVTDGVTDELAQLGRSLIREADQHGWDPDLRAECGWADSGAAMIQCALSDPDAARERWGYLMDTDGERVDPDEM